MPVQLLETVLFYIDFHAPTYAQRTDFRKTIFIFLRQKNKIFFFIYFILFFSNTGGTDINVIAQRNHYDNIERSDYDITEFQRALANAAYGEKGF